MKLEVQEVSTASFQIGLKSVLYMLEGEQFHRTHLGITTIKNIKLWTTLSRFLDYKPLLYFTFF